MPRSPVRRLCRAVPCRNFCCPLPVSQLPFSLALPTVFSLIYLNTFHFQLLAAVISLSTLYSAPYVSGWKQPHQVVPHPQSQCSSNHTSDAYTFLPHADYTSYSLFDVGFTFGFSIFFNTILPPFLPHLKAKKKASVREMKFDWMLKLHRADGQRWKYHSHCNANTCLSCWFFLVTAEHTRSFSRVRYEDQKLFYTWALEKQRKQL